MDINKKEEILTRRDRLSPAKQALLEKRLRGEVKSNSPNNVIPRRSSTAATPLSFAQQRLWFLHQLEPDSPLYNEHGVIQMKGFLDVAILERSLNEIVRRHETLRTTFEMVEGQPIQAIAPTLTLTVPVVNLCQLPEAEQKAEVQRLATEQSQQTFDLVRDSLLRWTVLQLGEQDHVLLLTMHHIICDGWSLGVLLRELTALYDAFSTGRPSPLTELPIQYADFALWQRQWLTGEVLDAQLGYWKQQLGNPPPLLQLPTDYPRPAVQTFRGAKTSFCLAAHFTQALKVLSQKEDVTLFMTLLAAFKTLLYRWSGTEDIAVGSPIANRNRTEIEGLIGCFINTLVLRTDLSGNPSFCEFLRRVREVALGAYAHQDLPFEQLVEVLQPVRSLSHTPLFQVMFEFGNTPMSALESPGLALSLLETDSTTAKFDLSLSMRETEEGLIGSLEYNTDLFEAAAIARMLGHFQTLLESIISHPQQRLSDLPLLTEAERHQLLVEWNQTEVDYPKDVCLHQLFEAQVERTPDAVAVIFEEQQLTYRELNAKANQLAHYLQKLGVKPEVLVGICVERSLEMVIGLLGILKAGGAYVPLDPAYPKERLGFMLADAKVPVLLTQERLAALLPEHHAQVLYLDANWEEISQQNQNNAIAQITSENLAYTIYTSGSTGKPKGVQIPHKALVNFLTAMRLTPGITEKDILLSVTTLSFDIAALELYLPLIAGARLILVSREVAIDGSQLLKQLTTSGATIVQATPATWRLLLTAGWSGQSLKILCGGEALDPSLCSQLLERGSEVWNLYGPTETTIWSAVHRVESQKSLEGTISIGRPIANTEFYVLNSHQQLVPVGVPGELYIGGAGVARGYLNRPELTAEKFIANPFESQKSGLEKLYKTGDLVRYRSDGNLEYLGRIDNQVKVRGFRIELGEIETALSQHPAVRETVVIVREDESKFKHLVAYVVLDLEQKLTSTELRRFLEEKLPNYMVPSIFVMLDALPLTPNGKIDRRSLPAPEMLRPQLDVAYVMPKTEVERAIADIWQKALKIEKVGIHDNFFELGGHSLLMMKVYSQLCDRFKTNLSMLDLFRYPTISALGEYLIQDKTQISYEIDIELTKIKVGQNQQRKRLQKMQAIGKNTGAIES